MNYYIPIMESKVNNMTILSVCIGSSCHINGSYNVIQTFQQLIEENHLHEKIDFKAEFCSKMCNQEGVSVNFNGETFNITPENAYKFFDQTVLTLINQSL